MKTLLFKFKSSKLESCLNLIFLFLLSVFFANSLIISVYKSQTLLLLLVLNLKYFLFSRINAITKYIIIGEPKVKNERYIKYIRILVVFIPSFCPHHSHTPKAWCSNQLITFLIIAIFIVKLNYDFFISSLPILQLKHFLLSQCSFLS